MNDPNLIHALLDAFRLVIPEVVLLVGACVLFVGATYRADRHVWGVVALLFLIGAGVALALSPRSPL